jgi:hypothetical protein
MKRYTLSVVPFNTSSMGCFALVSLLLVVVSDDKICSSLQLFRRGVVKVGLIILKVRMTVALYPKA